MSAANYRYLFTKRLFQRILTTYMTAADYKNWTRDQLIERLIALEGPRSVNVPTVLAPLISSTLSSQKQPAPAPIPIPIPVPTSVLTSLQKSFDFSKYGKRKIALKFCYSGWEFGGLAWQNGVTPLPTVEGVLFEAMVKARLVDREKGGGGLDGCGWERCGRTDKGVSAAGQVVSLWVRSNFCEPVEGVVEEDEEEEKVGKEVKEDVEKEEEEEEDSGFGLEEGEFGSLDFSRPSSVSPERPTNELNYIGILNNILPPTIRILAWTPVSPTFSARFSCKYRHYKYFFSSDFSNISAMRAAAAKLVGEHDFRNLCKVDAQKQITMFRRKVIRADIERVDEDGGTDLFVLNLVGSAFLYHQVRHIMAILFLIGSGLEKPSLITKLLNAVPGGEPSPLGDEELEVLDRKPIYQMADALPLMLWDCGYAAEDVQWRSGCPNETEGGVGGSAADIEANVHQQLYSIWHRSRVHTVLDRHFLQAAERYHKASPSLLPLLSGEAESNVPVNYPLGGGNFKRVQKYEKVMNRKRLDTVEAINARWRTGKGLRRAQSERGDDGNE